MTTTRTANHTICTYSSATIHYAADAANAKPYHVMACTGRAVDGFAGSITTTHRLGLVDCKICLKALAAGRIVLASPVPA